tara:strand:- start:7265 stop:7504 length:240 start_codon:yes stop_codon:yes gene_type:complete
MQTEQLIVQALFSKFKSRKDEALANLSILINSSVGVGEHISHVQEAEEQIRKIAEAEECISVLEGMININNPNEPSPQE